jgi:hypothetical protein
VDSIEHNVLWCNESTTEKLSENMNFRVITVMSAGNVLFWILPLKKVFFIVHIGPVSTAFLYSLTWG